MDEKVLMAIQLCLADEVVDKFFRENNILNVEVTSEPLYEEVIDESVDLAAVSSSSLHA